MLYFNWLKKDRNKSEATTPVPPNVPGILTVRKVDDLLARHKGLIVQINELAGLSERNYHRYYLHAMRNFARFVQLLPASEVHHHAGAGGMLTHTLEVCVNALKIRRSYLLSETGGAEEIAAKQDLWTYAVFLAALCHDVAKVAVDQTVTVYDLDHQSKSWSPWESFLDEQGAWYSTEFQHGRQYRLHEKASLLLIHRIIPAYALNWISGDRYIFAHWLACVSGDIDNASSIGEIIGIADGKSVATNLGADSSRMPVVKTKPLHEKMLTALRYLLNAGELPLNRNGAAGWISGEDCWLVSKRTVDAIRDQLTQEGHTGVPTKNGRLFDILQEHGALIPCGDKAIWTVVVEGEGWRNELTMIRIAVAKIWSNPDNRPNEFEGRIIPAEVEASTKLDASAGNEKSRPGPKATPMKTGSDQELIEESQYNQGNEPSLTMEAEDESPASSRQQLRHDFDLQNFLPSDDSSLDESQPVNPDPDAIKTESINYPNAQSKSAVPVNDETDDPAETFFAWLRNGIQSGEIKTNRPKARVHIVDEGVALMTPGIFQDYASAQTNGRTDWASIQKKVLKKNWHVRDVQGLNVIKYRVEGGSKSAKINVILFHEVSLVFGGKEPPTANPHLNRIR
ncbi:MobH family relaxase [Methylotuvimicrobium buryatense]|uniref:MobH family relaxase n=1 Tax=Methylotuvimicrobium buryatense TaxID=95641 RepID=UPI00034CD9C0|nr:MobH family relaxase [Methylotuvimicrobium buryatense]